MKGGVDLKKQLPPKKGFFLGLGVLGFGLCSGYFEGNTVKRLRSPRL